MAAYSQGQGVMVVQPTASADGEAERMQRGRSRTVLIVLSFFAIVALALGLTITVLNAKALSGGVRIYQGAYISSSGRSFSERNYYPGLWYGITNMIFAAFSILFAVAANSSSKQTDGGVARSGCIRSMGITLAWLFGLLAFAGIAADILAVITMITVGDFFSFIRESGDCVYMATERVCSCGGSHYVTNTPSCEFVRSSLFSYYRSMSAVIFFVFVADIVVSSLFCGVLCCCAGPARASSQSTQTVVVATAYPTAVGIPVAQPHANQYELQPQQKDAPPSYNQYSSQTVAQQPAAAAAPEHSQYPTPAQPPLAALAYGGADAGYPSDQAAVDVKAGAKPSAPPSFM